VSGSLLVAFGWVLAGFAGVDAADLETMGPAITSVFISVRIWLISVACIKLESLDVGHGGGELIGEVVVVGNKSGKGLAIRFSGAGKTGKGIVGCIFFFNILGQICVVTGLLAGLLLEAKGTLGEEKMFFEICPCLGCWDLFIPFFAFVKIQPSVKH
jgi:hypothetical protein